MLTRTSLKIQGHGLGLSKVKFKAKDFSFVVNAKTNDLCCP